MSNRDIGQEILEGIRDVKAYKAGAKTLRVHTLKQPAPPQKIRIKLKLSQAAFAGLMGVSLRTVQDWEQGRRKPSGPLLRYCALQSKSLKYLNSCLEQRNGFGKSLVFQNRFCFHKHRAIISSWHPSPSLPVQRCKPIYVRSAYCVFFYLNRSLLPSRIHARPSYCPAQTIGRVVSDLSDLGQGIKI